MGILKNLIILAIFIGIVYYLISLYEPNVIPTIEPKTLPNRQIINGSIGNNVNANYSYMYNTSLSITKKYNEPINHLILFTGNSSNTMTETNNEQQFASTLGSPYFIKYDGFYTPIAQNISDEFINNTTYIPSLIGKKVYIEFKTNNNNTLTIQVPYIVKSEQIGKPKVLWILVQDTGISNSTAINIKNLNSSDAKQTISFAVGIYYNGTEILFPSKS